MLRLVSAPERRYGFDSRAHRALMQLKMALEKALSDTAVPATGCYSTYEVRPTTATRHG